MKKNFIFIIIGLISIVYYLALNSIMGKVAFSEIFLIIGLGLIIYEILNKKFKFNKSKKYKKPMKILKILMFIVLIVFIGIEGIIIGFGANSDKGTCDYNIILGAGLKGEEMTLSLKERMNKAIEYNKDKNNYIVVTGGRGPGETIPEALAMKRYLVQNGIEEKRVLIEDNARNTMENFKFSKEIIEKNSGKTIDELNIKVITSNYHCFRSSILAKRNGYIKLSFIGNKTNPLLAPTYYTREFFGIFKSLIFDRVWKFKLNLWI